MDSIGERCAAMLHAIFPVYYVMMHALIIRALLHYTALKAPPDQLGVILLARPMAVELVPCRCAKFLLLADFGDITDHRNLRAYTLNQERKQHQLSRFVVCRPKGDKGDVGATGVIGTITLRSSGFSPVAAGQKSALLQVTCPVNTQVIECFLTDNSPGSVVQLETYPGRQNPAASMCKVHTLFERKALRGKLFCLPI
jgi:hypothetical protein